MTTTLRPPSGRWRRPMLSAHLQGTDKSIGGHESGRMPPIYSYEAREGAIGELQSRHPALTLPEREANCSADGSEECACRHSSHAKSGPRGSVSPGAYQTVSPEAAAGLTRKARFSLTAAHNCVIAASGLPGINGPHEAEYQHPRTAIASAKQEPGPLSCTKSAKRRAAEALLAARFAAQPGSGAATGTALPHAASYSSLHTLSHGAADLLPLSSSAPSSPSREFTPPLLVKKAASGASSDLLDESGLRWCHDSSALNPEAQHHIGPAAVDPASDSGGDNGLESNPFSSSDDYSLESDAADGSRTESVRRVNAIASSRGGSHLARLSVGSLAAAAAAAAAGVRNPAAATVQAAGVLRGAREQPSGLAWQPLRPTHHHHDHHQIEAARQPAGGRVGPVQPAAKRPRVSLSDAATSSLGGGASPPQRPVTVVPSCDPARGCKTKLATVTAALAAPAKPALEPGSGAGAGAAAPGSGLPTPWCSFEVKLPSLNWKAVFDEPPGVLQRTGLGRGYEKLVLPEGLVSYVVESPTSVEDALSRLRASMQDRVIAIDLEWRPETTAGRISPVAVLQLSSATVCLVLRTSAMGYALPPPVAAFLADPSLVLVGFAWDSADESKMRSTFGIGRSNFRRFVDLKEVATLLGYHDLGLARLAHQVLGVPLHKSKAVSRSNWAAPQLTNHQLKYASLDVLVAGQLFRALRLWHSSPSPCGSCRNPIGDLSELAPLCCEDPGCTGRTFTTLGQYKSHCVSTGHTLRYGTCGACGRLYDMSSGTGPASAEEAGESDDER